MGKEHDQDSRPCIKTGAVPSAFYQFGLEFDAQKLHFESEQSQADFFSFFFFFFFKLENS